MIPFSLLYAHIFSDKRRTILTVLGIVIAVSSVYSLLIIGDGFEQGILSQFDEVGLNTLIIQERTQGFGGVAPSRGLTEEEYDVVERSPRVERSTYLISRPLEVSFDDETVFPQVLGIPVDEDIELAYDFSSIAIEQGRRLQRIDSSQVTIGRLYTDGQFFDSVLRPRSTILVDGKEFRVAGIHEPGGSRPDDLVVVGPASSLFDEDEKYTYIVVKPSGNVEEAIRILERDLRRSRGDEPGEETVSVQRLSDFVSSFLDILSAFQTVVVVVAGVSVVVGGIGVINTMRMAVLQRRSSIGVMKSVGATKKDIFQTFLVESIILGFLGGVIGLVLGVLFTEFVGFVISLITPTELLLVSQSYTLLSGFLLGTSILGGVAGSYPAWKASQLDPVLVLEEE